MEKEKVKKELSADEVAKQINDAKKFIEKLMSMSRKERRKFAKKAKVKWDNMPKYTKELADKESRHIRKTTEEEDLAKKKMKIERKNYKKNRKK